MSERDRAAADSRPSPGDLFTPKSGRYDILEAKFEGFGESMERVRGNDVLARKRLSDLEREVKEMKRRMDELEGQVVQLKAEKNVWRNAYNELHIQVTLNEKKADETEVKEKELKENHKVWEERQEKDNICFRSIVEEQFNLWGIPFHEPSIDPWCH